MSILDGKFEVDTKTINEKSKEITKSVALFKPYSTKFFDKTITSLDSMDSSFINQMNTKVMKKLKSKGPKLVKEIENLGKGIHDANEQFKEMDRVMGKSCSVKKK